jgi:UDP-3-O-[3-hydroxymyristoyl] glucosamine N-acyltransferase
MAAGRIRLRELAAELGRTFEGDGEVEIRGVAALEHAGAGDLAHVRSLRRARGLALTKASALILPPGVDAAGRPAIRSAQPALDFARAVRRLHPEPPAPAGVDPSAVVDPEARIDPGASVGPRCVVGPRTAVGSGSRLHAGVVLYPDVAVGCDCEIHSGCVLREGTQLGDRVKLQPGVVLGGDGFGYVMDEVGRFEPVPQIGRVVVEDDVEIGANTTVDRGTLAETRIGRGARIDNLVQIAHNCRIGEDAVIVAQAGIAGSSRVGRGAMVLAQAGIADHVQVGERAFVAPGSGVHADVPARERVMGYPHRELGSFRRIWAALGHLPAIARRLRAVERRLGLRGEDDRRGG